MFDIELSKTRVYHSATARERALSAKHSLPNNFSTQAVCSYILASANIHVSSPV